MAMTDRLRVGSLCTGYGGLEMAVHAVFEAELAWCADNDRRVAALLAARWPQVHNLGDLTEVGWTAVPAVDLVTAGFPCQDISFAGRGAGIGKDTRSGLWITIVDILRLVRPPLVFLENVAALRSRGLPRVLGDLAALGYDAAWLCLRASDVGAPHRRDRLFLLAARPGRPSSWHAELRPAPRPPDRGGLLPTAAHPGGQQGQRLRTGGELAGAPTTPACGPGDAAQHRRTAAADPQGGGQAARQLQSVRLARGPEPVGGGAPDWGDYEPAIRRWEHLLGRPAPWPVEPGRTGHPRLSTRFVEWMMGLPEGWVTELDLPRASCLRILGNGVVPQQAAHALALLHQALVGGERG